MAQSSTAAGREANLRERSAELAVLAEQLRAVTSRAGGRLAFVAGEAGVGNTALVRRFAATLPTPVQLMSGACDALVTPRPLAPFLDVAALTGGELEELALARTGAKPHEFAAGLMRELRQRAPSVIVLEDLHWADAATLDVLRIVARRVESVDSLIIATFRDDELDRMHPLRMLLGGLAGAGAVTRIKLAALSEAAVAQLAEPYRVDATELYRQTSGNAFYVTEVLAGGTHAVPATVQDAVLARTAQLSSARPTPVLAASTAPPAPR